MSVLRTNAWRFAFLAFALLMVAGGPLHPESDAEDSLREELATMTAGDTWVLSHSVVAVATAVLAAGLWAAHRSGTWPTSTRRALHLAAVAISIYVVETILHLAAVLDADALRDGESAPIAFTHIGLALVLYPVSGAAIALLAFRLFWAQRTAGKVVAVVGVTAGLLHALSVPMTIVFPDTELTPMFAGAAMLMAFWALGTAAVGVTRPAAGPVAPVLLGRPLEQAGQLRP